MPVASKPDSQDICFVPEGSYAKVVEKLRPGAGRGGDIVHLDGRVLGQHDGVIHYTIGQRRGLGVATGDPVITSYSIHYTKLYESLRVEREQPQ